ncbi:MAG: dTMP kinase [Clostridia bacterium]|nr:dTMP kinase [Clostridia bacterium]
MRGKFIVIEGLDGSGKGTQAALLIKYLASKGRKVFQTAEPTESVTGGLIRDVLSGARQRTSSELAALFMADRVAHNVNPVNGIEKTLEAGIDVICDRYYYSSIAYQAVGEDKQWVVDMNINCPSIRKPDVCIFFDVDPESCRKRLESGRVYLEIFERDIEQVQAIRARYHEAFDLLKDSDNIVVVDAARAPQEVAADVEKIVDKLFE